MGGKIVSDKLIGKYVNLREVTVDDADFILSLRCDENKSKFLHKTEYNLENQIAYIKKYFESFRNKRNSSTSVKYINE